MCGNVVGEQNSGDVEARAVGVIKVKAGNMDETKVDSETGEEYGQAE